MFRPSEVIVKLALEHFKKNIQIALTVNEITFLTQFMYIGPCIIVIVEE